MSMFDDVLGLGRSSIMESMVDGFEPEVEETALESVEALAEGTDPLDFMMQVAYENEINMRNLDMAIIAEEHMYLRENGSEMIYEETQIQSVIDKFKKSVQWLWGQIQKFFRTVMDKLDEFFRSDSKFLSKYKKDALAMKNIKLKGYDQVLFNPEAIEKKAVKIFGALKKQGDKYIKVLGKNQTVEEGEEDTEIANVMKAVFKSDEADKFIFKPEGAEKEEHEYNVAKAVEQLSNNKGSRKAVRKAYDENKKIINDHIRAAKVMESTSKKFKVLPTEASTQIHRTIKVLNKIGSTMTMVNRQAVKALNLARTQNKTIVASAAARGKGVNAVRKSTEKNESASLFDYELGGI